MNDKRQTSPLDGVVWPSLASARGEEHFGQSLMREVRELARLHPLQGEAMITDHLGGRQAKKRDDTFPSSRPP